MSSPLQKFPPGLLGRFDLKVLGDAPYIFGDTVMPSASVDAEYALPTRVIQSGQTNGIVAKDGSVTLTVPKRQIWEIHSIGLTALLAAAAVIPQLEINVQGCVVGCTQATPGTLANIYEQACVWSPPQRFLMGPDTTIVGSIRSTPNSAVDLLLRAIVAVYEA